MPAPLMRRKSECRYLQPSPRKGGGARELPFTCGILKSLAKPLDELINKSLKSNKTMSLRARRSQGGLWGTRAAAQTHPPPTLNHSPPRPCWTQLRSQSAEIDLKNNENLRFVTDERQSRLIPELGTMRWPPWLLKEPWAVQEGSRVRARLWLRRFIVSLLSNKV